MHFKKSIVEKKKTCYQTKGNHIGKKEELISWKTEKQETNISPEVWAIEESRAENVQTAFFWGCSESKRNTHIIEGTFTKKKQTLKSKEDSGIKQVTEVKPNHLEDPWQSFVPKGIPEELPYGAEVTCGQGKWHSLSRMRQIIIKILQKCRW